MEFTNLKKIFYPKTGTTKKEILDYYRAVSKYFLPHIKNRPLTIKRYPNGITKIKIYQRHLAEGEMKNNIKFAKIYVNDKKTNEKFILCDDLNSLLYLVQLGTLEFHPWLSSINPNKPDKTYFSQNFRTRPRLKESILNHPSFVVFDLDPPKGNFKKVVEVAWATKKILDRLNLVSYIKTSGKDGLHIYVPIRRKYTFDETRTFAYKIGEQLVKKSRAVTLESRLNKRKPGEVFFDYGQNAISRSLVAVYSLRATDQATVSFPVAWEQLHRINPEDFTLKTVPTILKKHGDTWKRLIKTSQNAKLP